MITFHKFLIGLATFICITAISGFVYALTLQSTLLDRTAVKGWLNESQIYEGKLSSILVQPSAPESEQGSASQQTTLALSPEALRSSLDATFSPDFVRTHVEGVIDNAYDWIEGKTAAFAFSIPVDEKRDTFIQQLAKAIEPQMAALPICESAPLSPNSLCRPSTMSVEQLANQTASESVAESDMFSKPITNESFAQAAAEASPSNNNTSLSQLPTISNIIDILLVILPIIAILCAAAAIYFTANGRRLATAAHLTRRNFFSLLFTLISAAVIAWIVGSDNFSLSSLFPPQTSELFVPLVKTIVIGILGTLALISGVGVAISAAIWTVLVVWRRKRPNPLASPSNSQKQF